MFSYTGRWRVTRHADTERLTLFLLLLPPGSGPLAILCDPKDWPPLSEPDAPQEEKASHLLQPCADL